MYMYINLKLWRQKMIYQPRSEKRISRRVDWSPYPWCFFQNLEHPIDLCMLGTPKIKKTMAFSICRDNRMRKHISCSVDFMSHRKYNTYINTQKSFYKKELSKAQAVQNPAQVHLLPCPCEMQYFKLCRTFLECCHFPWEVHHSKFIAPTYWQKDPAIQLPFQRHNETHET